MRNFFIKHRILIVNFILFFILFLCCEYYVYKTEIGPSDRRDKFYESYFSLPMSFYKKWLIAEMNGLEPKIPKNISLIRFNRYSEELQRKFIKKPILLLGCSFTHSGNIPDEQCYSTQLSNYTNRLVYNRGISGAGIQHAIFMLKNSLNKTIDEPEYIIHTFIGDQVRRLKFECSLFERQLLFYDFDKNNELYLLKDYHHFYWNSYILRKLRAYLYMDEYSYSPEASKLLLFHFLELNKEVKKNFKNSKFVIFVYNGDEFIKKIEDRLKDDGVKIIYLSDISSINVKDKQYVLEDGEHPNAQAWSVVVPLLSKELNL